MKKKMIYETPLIQINSIAVENGIAVSGQNEANPNEMPSMEEVNTTWN